MDALPQPEQTYRLHPVSVPGFEGPLDLLLSLIEGEKLDISAISLASVTDQYVARLKAMERFPVEHLADFLVVAATLLLLKSKRLFPDLALTEEEEENIASLEEQLREYQRFRQAAKRFAQVWGSAPLWARESFQGVTAAFYPPPGFGISEMRAAMDSVLERLPKLEALEEDVVRRVISIEERIREIQSRIAAEAKTTFSALARTAASKVEVIVSFLALLELVKQQIVVAEQRSAFRDIVVKRGADTARP